MYQVQWNDPNTQVKHIVRFHDLYHADDYAWSIANSFTDTQVSISDMDNKTSSNLIVTSAQEVK
jgi:hypothetical protein